MKHPQQNDPLKDMFHTAFNDFEAGVNDEVWENIKEELHPTHKKRAFWWQWAAAAVFVGAISSYAWWKMQESAVVSQFANDNNIEKNSSKKVMPNRKYQDSIERNKLIAENDKQQKSLSDTYEMDIKETAVAKVEPIKEQKQSSFTENDIEDIKNTGIVTEKPKEIEQTVANVLANIDSVKPPYEEAAAVALADNKETVDLMQDNTIEKVLPLPPSLLSLMALTKLPEDYTVLQAQYEPVKKTSAPPDRWALAANVQLFGGGGVSSSSNANEQETLANADGSFSSPTGTKNTTTGGGGSVYQSDSSITSFYSVSSSSTIGTVEIPNVFTPNNNNASKSFNAPDFSTPLTTSITVNYRLGKRWSIESGLSYTILKSKSETPIVDNEKIELVVAMNYLGIPLIVSREVLSRKRFSMYSSLGIIAEIGLSSRYELTRIISEEVDENVVEKFPLKDNQGAAFFGIGMDYQFNKWLSYYLQPGVAAYFVSADQLYNVRSKHIFWSSIQTGLRVHL